MANPPKQKGTAEETRIVRLWNDHWGHEVARREPASSRFDIRVVIDRPVHEPLEVLATRADRGRCLYTLTEEQFLALFAGFKGRLTTPVHIESKRYARFSLHSIFHDKFGRS